MTSTALALVTVSYGSDDALAALFASLCDATTHPLLIVAADNLPGTGRAKEIVSATGGSYLPMTSNRGYGGAINAAVATLPPEVEWVVITNPDVTFLPGSIDTLRRTAESDARAASVGPLIRNDDGTVYPSARAVPSIRVGIGHGLFANIWPGNPWTARYHADTATDRPRAAGWLSGACLLVRRSAFEAGGGFDEGFFMYFEDVDLGYRFAKNDWHNIYQPAAEVVHTGAHSTSGSSVAMVRAHHRSAERFISKKYSSPVMWPVRTALLAGLRLRSLVAERRSRRGERTTSELVRERRRRSGREFE
ncbi:glycosyltransferase family 2 protein [Luethyella okanaganae]|uniref:Glycosyltransferase n=1 Tax=Luethyella okanaganae TaxID=69372 RepID=A0ABW1VA03_9MICO